MASRPSALNDRTTRIELRVGSFSPLSAAVFLILASTNVHAQSCFLSGTSFSAVGAGNADVTLIANGGVFLPNGFPEPVGFGPNSFVTSPTPGVFGTNGDTGGDIPFTVPSDARSTPGSIITISVVTFIPGSHTNPAGTNCNTNSVDISVTNLNIATTGPLPNANDGVPYDPFQFTATGGSGSYSWVGATFFGLTLSGSGVLSGTPNGSGTQTLPVCAMDTTPAIACSSFSISFSVSSLAITQPTSLPAGTVGVPYGPVTYMATGGSGGYSWTVSGQPNGLNISSSGVLSGTPGTNTQSQFPYLITAKVQDSNGATATKTLPLTINPAATPSLTVTQPTSLPAATVGVPYGPVTYMATGGNGGYSWTVSGQPNGLNISLSGVLSGTPGTNTQSQFPYQIVAKVQDSSGATASKALPLTVNAAPQTLTISPTSLAAGTEGVPYVPVPFTASGGSGTYNWSANNLPSGMSMDRMGVLSGTPTSGTHGLYTVTITVTDSVNNRSTRISLLLTINPSSLAILLPGTLPTGTEGVPYGSVTFMASGGAGGYTWAVSSQPKGLTISSTGVLSGTPGIGSHGHYKLTVTVTDANNISVDIMVPLTINAAQATEITLSTKSLSFTYIQGNAVPVSQSFGVLGSGGVAGYSVAASASSGGNWLTASPAIGQTPGNVTVSLQNLASLSPGSYQGTVTVQPQSNAIPAQPVTVSLKVTGTPPQMSLSTKDLRITAIAGAPLAIGIILVMNTGGGTINYSTINTDSAAWLTVVGGTGTATSSTPGFIVLLLTPTGLSPGTYTDKVTVTGAGQQITVTVTLQINPAMTVIVPSATGMTFTAVAGAASASPVSQTVAVLNGGQGTMNWASRITSNSPWLTIATASGSSDAFGTSQPGITLTLDPTSLAEGNYYASINLTVPGGSASNSPNPITTLLKILPADSQVPPAVSTSGFIFTTAEGGAAPASQQLNFINGGGNAVSYTFTAATDDGQSWLSASPVTGSVPAGGSSPLSVQVDPTGLVGVYHGQLRFGFSNGTAENVDVVFLVAPAPAVSTATKSASVRPEDSSSCSQYGISFVQPVPTDSGTVIAGQSYVLQVQSLCVPSPPSALNLEIDFSDGTGPLYPTYDATSGTYEATWTPATAGPLQFTARSIPTNAEGLPVEVGATATPLFSVTVAGPDPNGSAILQGVRNSASYVMSNEVAAGSLISIFGQQLATTETSASNAPFPTTLAEIHATLGDVALPLYFANAGQVNAIVPFLPDKSLNTALGLVLQRGNTTAPPLSLNLVQFQPGIFSTNQKGSGQGAIKNALNQLVDSSHPAKPGDTIVIYGAGMGPVTNPPAPGAVAGTESLTTNQPTVYIDGIKAQVTYSGLSPGSVQLYQVNAVVPRGIRAGTINVYLTMTETLSNAVAPSNIVTIN